MQNRVIDLRPVDRQLRGDGEPPDNDGMEHRIAKLETLAEKTSERLGAIEKDVSVIKSNYATKEDLALLKADMQKSLGDLQKTINDQTWKLIGTVVTLSTLLSGIVFYIARNVH